MIHFNVPHRTGNEIRYMKEAVESGTICGDGFSVEAVVNG